MATTNTKPFWKSSTFWLNIAGVAVILLQILMQQAFINPEWQALILAVINILNRFRTTQPITLR